MAGKSETKSKTGRTRERNYLSDVAEDKVFWSHDGQIFKNQYELERGLNSMSDEAYRYHANAEKNDFSTWVREAIGDDSLAKSLDKASNRLDAAMRVEERIHHFSK